MSTWREKINNEVNYRGEDVNTLFVGPDVTVLDVEFDDGSSGIEGPEFLAWTENYVYFPVEEYDGAESVRSAPRNPRPIGQRHVGGW